MSLYKIEEKFVSTSKDIIKLINSYLDQCEYCEKNKPIVFYFKNLPLKYVCKSCWKNHYCKSIFNETFNFLEDHLRGILFIYHPFYYANWYTMWINKYIKLLSCLFTYMHKQYPHLIYHNIVQEKLKELKTRIGDFRNTRRLSLIKHIFSLWYGYLSLLS